MYALEPEPERYHRWRVFGIAALITTFLQAGVLLWASGIERKVVKEIRTRISMQVVRRPFEPKRNETPVVENVLPNRKIKHTPTTSKKSTHTSIRASKPMPTKKKPIKPKPSVPLVVGLTLSSTVQGGRGPRFAVGNTSMGIVERKAQAPQNVTPLNPTQDGEAINTSSLSNGKYDKEHTEAKLLKKTIPDYPIRARTEGIEGVIVLALTINSRGRVETVRLIKGLGHGLDESALIAARKTIWQPATIEGRPVRSVRRYNVRFTLES